jgi:hypothetical protein
MPGPVSDSYQGPSDRSPYVPSWCFPGGIAPMCPCGHHEGYHSDSGQCLLRHECHCKGFPQENRAIFPEEQING